MKVADESLQNIFGEYKELSMKEYIIEETRKVEF